MATRRDREAKRVVIVISWLLRVGVERGHFARGPARYRREEMGYHSSMGTMIEFDL
jgi:hypothetical protein